MRGNHSLRNPLPECASAPAITLCDMVLVATLVIVNVFLLLLTSDIALRFMQQRHAKHKPSGLQTSKAPE